jgi:hypothetical protein
MVAEALLVVTQAHEVEGLEEAEAVAVEAEVLVAEETEAEAVVEAEEEAEAVVKAEEEAEAVVEAQEEAKVVVEVEEEVEVCRATRAEDNCPPSFAPSQEPDSTGQPPSALE